MTTATDFEWPKALRPIRAAAEAGALDARSLYPVEVRALIELVAGAPLTDSPREIAPGMVATRREDQRGEGTLTNPRETRTAYFFICRFANGRVWQCSLFTDWIWAAQGSRHIAAATELSPRNIAQALTRSIIDRGPR